MCLFMYTSMSFSASSTLRGEKKSIICNIPCINGERITQCYQGCSGGMDFQVSLIVAMLRMRQPVSTEGMPYGRHLTFSPHWLFIASQMQTLSSSLLFFESWYNTLQGVDTQYMWNTLHVLWVECLPQDHVLSIWSLAGAIIGGFIWKLQEMGPSQRIQATGDIILKIILGTQSLPYSLCFLCVLPPRALSHHGPGIKRVKVLVQKSSKPEAKTNLSSLKKFLPNILVTATQKLTH